MPLEFKPRPQEKVPTIEEISEFLESSGPVDRTQEVEAAQEDSQEYVSLSAGPVTVPGISDATELSETEVEKYFTSNPVFNPDEPITPLSTMRETIPASEEEVKEILQRHTDIQKKWDEQSENIRKESTADSEQKETPTMTFTEVLSDKDFRAMAAVVADLQENSAESDKIPTRAEKIAMIYKIGKILVPEVVILSPDQYDKILTFVEDFYNK